MLVFLLALEEIDGNLYPAGQSNKTVQQPGTYNADLSTDKVLLAQVPAGNDQSFRALYDLWRDKVYKMAMHITRSEMVAEDLVQDVFLKVWMAREKLHKVEHFNAWLSTVARNTANSYLRRLALEHLGLDTIRRQHRGDNNTTQSDAALREYEKLLHAAIEQLSPQRKKVYQLHREQGMKHEQIARELSISIATVKEHSKVAMDSIRSFLDRHLDSAVIIAIALHMH